MTEQERQLLKRGDIIQSALGDSYVVISSVNGRVMAVREVYVVNAVEWTLIARSELAPEKKL